MRNAPRELAVHFAFLLTAPLRNLCLLSGRGALPVLRLLCAVSSRWPKRTDRRLPDVIPSVLAATTKNSTRLRVGYVEIGYEPLGAVGNVLIGEIHGDLTFCS